MTLNENIRELRRQKNLRQEQLAEAMGVSTASISKWETGQCAPELTALLELADFFEVSLDALVGHRLAADRLETLILEMKKAVDARKEEEAALLCEKLLRNYPNSSRAVEACAEGCYRLFVYTEKEEYMERCIAQNKRLMRLNADEPERKRLERIHALGNQYALLSQWSTAKEYYEQSNVCDVNKGAIAECLLHQGEPQKAIALISDVLAERIFQDDQIIFSLADAWIAMGEKAKACAALEWMDSVMESLQYDPTARMLIQVKLAGLYEECQQPEAAEQAMRKAAELARENSYQEVKAAASFLQFNQPRKLLVSGSESNRDLLRGIAKKMGERFAAIVEESLA